MNLYLMKNYLDKKLHSLFNLCQTFVKEGYAYIHTDIDFFPLYKNSVDYTKHIVL